MNPTRLFSTIAVCFFAVSFFIPVAGADPVKELKFTAIPDQDTARLQQRFGKIADYLTKETGITFVYVPVKSYSASVQAFKNNEVQMAWFGGLSGVQARLGVPGSKAIAQGVEDPHFVSYIIAHHSTGLTYQDALTDNITGKTFTFGSKGSTSGRLMPEYFIRKHFNRPPDQIFSKVGFSGDHSKTIALVQSGSYQVGAVNFKVWKKELEAGKIDPSKVSIIWKTPGYPDYNWTVRADVDQVFGSGTTEKVQQAIINITDPELLNAFPRKQFIKADNTMYQKILDTGKAIGIFR